jgi:hypothetical protein
VLPTTLDGVESLLIPGTDKFFAGVDGTWIFQGTLCVDTLENTFAQTLRDYPHAAGRLSCDRQTQEWRIRLTNDGVPITIGSTNLPYATDEWFHNNGGHPDLIGELFSLAHNGLDDKIFGRSTAYIIPSAGIGRWTIVATVASV